MMVLFNIASFRLALVVVGLFWHFGDATPGFAGSNQGAEETKFPRRVNNGDFAGAEACGECHQAEKKAWAGSHHRLAMQQANGSSVLGDFNEAKFVHRQIESTFFKRNDKYYVRTDGADGRLAEFEISYTFGVFPLQQYLIAFPGGRLQALTIAWDSRTREEGGQRWFHLQSDDDADPAGRLHWTGLYQNWNLQCAECHSTNLRKGYQSSTRAYATTFSEINVACEACHGPGARHVDWAKNAKAPYSTLEDKGLYLSLKSRWREAWDFPTADAAVAKRDRPAGTGVMNVCANCHSRRSTIFEDVPSGRSLEHSHVPALPLSPNYYADGQQREEVYVWGSFLQSKMFQRGVTCVDCHEPHTLKLRAEDNALCGRCHNPELFDTAKHSFHRSGGAGAQCANCHMPAQKYMVVDARRDHAIRVPRPDISIAIGSPNACTNCHSDQKPEWALEAMDRWYGRKWRDRPTDAFVLHSGTIGDPRSLPKLLDIAKDGSRPGIVRAAALTLAHPLMRQESFNEVSPLLKDVEPMVRMSALGLAERLNPTSRLSTSGGLLSDDVRGVRTRAAATLAGIPNNGFPDNLRGSREQALQEYVQSLQLNIDWPATNVSLGELFARQGRLAEARSAFERAVELDRMFSVAYVSLAELERSQNDDAKAEAVLRAGLDALPTSAELRYTLGLTLVRRSQSGAALAELAKATELAPENSRYAYVYAIGLNSAGRRDEAFSRLREINRRHPYSIESLIALVSLSRDMGDLDEAATFAKKLAELLPDNQNAQQLLRDLRRKP